MRVCIGSDLRGVLLPLVLLLIFVLLGVRRVIFAHMMATREALVRLNLTLTI